MSDHDLIERTITALALVIHKARQWGWDEREVDELYRAIRALTRLSEETG